MRTSLRRPSPALVVACIALAVALGGTSYATVLQVPRNSVGPLQLKTSAVTTRKLAANAVTSAKVQNGTLVPADFKSSTLPAGPVGPAGPAGPAGAPGLSGVERVETVSAANSSSLKSAFIACPAGKRLIGGGARTTPSLVGVGLSQSYPDNDNIYRAQAREFTANPGNWSVTVYAVCANAS